MTQKMSEPYAMKINEDCKKLQEDLDAIHNWTNDSLLKFHPDKCRHLHVSTRQEHHHTYLLGPEQHPVQHTSQEKDIGVTFDEQLTFEHHLNEKINKSNSIVGIHNQKNI